MMRRVAEEFDGSLVGKGVVDWTAIFVGFLDEIWETICNLVFGRLDPTREERRGEKLDPSFPLAPETSPPL